MYLFITSTTYGQWLPGDERGFVSNVRSESIHREKHNQFGSMIDRDVPKLKYSAKLLMKGESILFNQNHAETLFSQLQETATCRNWLLIGIAIMANHIHVLLEVSNDVDSHSVIRDIKCYCSKKLNSLFENPVSGTWWTTGGSIRRKKETEIPRMIEYIKKQPSPLLVWINPAFE